MNSFGFQALFRNFLKQKNGIEPRVDFKVFDDYTEFSASAEYDFASLAVSPRYSPAEADVLVNVIKEYFDLI